MKTNIIFIIYTANPAKSSKNLNLIIFIKNFVCKNKNLLYSNKNKFNMMQLVNL